MPSERRQLNVRLDDQGWEMLNAVVARMRAALGIEVSHSDAVRAGLMELSKKYPDAPARPAKPARKPRKQP